MRSSRSHKPHFRGRQCRINRSFANPEADSEYLSEDDPPTLPNGVEERPRLLAALFDPVQYGVKPAAGKVHLAFPVALRPKDLQSPRLPLKVVKVERDHLGATEAASVAKGEDRGIADAPGGVVLLAVSEEGVNLAG